MRVELCHKVCSAFVTKRMHLRAELYVLQRFAGADERRHFGMLASGDL